MVPVLVLQSRGPGFESLVGWRQSYPLVHVRSYRRRMVEVNPCYSRLEIVFSKPYNVVKGKGELFYYYYYYYLSLGIKL